MKKISAEAKDLLTKLDENTVLGLNELRKNGTMYDALITVIRYLIDYEKDRIMAMNSGNDNLLVDHANAKGRVAGLTLMIHLIEGSEDEVEKREEKQ